MCKESEGEASEGEEEEEQDGDQEQGRSAGALAAKLAGITGYMAGITGVTRITGCIPDASYGRVTALHRPEPMKAGRADCCTCAKHVYTCGIRTLCTAI